MAGASFSEHGRSLVCLPSTANTAAGPVSRIKKTVASFRSPDVIVSFENIKGSIWTAFECGKEEVRFDTGIESPEKFKRFDFAATVFSLLDAKTEVTVSMDKKMKILMLDIEHERTNLRYVITEKVQESSRRQPGPVARSEPAVSRLPLHCIRCAAGGMMALRGEDDRRSWTTNQTSGRRR